MVVEIKADVDNARAIANDMDSYGESVSESAGRCGQEAYSRDTAFGKYRRSHERFFAARLQRCENI